MWAADSEIHSTKESKGTRQENRKDPMTYIQRAMDGNAAGAVAITSFAVNLLPLFPPNKAVHAADITKDDYNSLIEDIPVFCAMAWYLRSIDFDFNKEHKSLLTRMATRFEQLHDPLSIAADPHLQSIESAIAAWKPTVGNRIVKEVVAKEKVLNFMFITYAMELDPDFKVFACIYGVNN